MSTLINPSESQTFYSKYVDIVTKICNSNGIPSNSILICTPTFLELVKDMERDLDFLVARRLLNGANSCKIAGIILWRLSRSSVTKFISTMTACSKNDVIRYINFHAGLAFVIQEVLGEKVDKFISTSEKPIYQELKYLIAHRHTNQEMVGLYFQILCAHKGCCKNVTTSDLEAAI